MGARDQQPAWSGEPRRAVGHEVIRQMMFSIVLVGQGAMKSQTKPMKSIPFVVCYGQRGDPNILA